MSTEITIRNSVTIDFFKNNRDERTIPTKTVIGNPKDDHGGCDSASGLGSDPAVRIQAAQDE